MMMMMIVIILSFEYIPACGILFSYAGDTCYR